MRYYRCQSATLIRARRPVHSTRPAMLSVTRCSILYRLRREYGRRFILFRAATVRRPGPLEIGPPELHCSPGGRLSAVVSCSR
jgi:hypothetical protein